MPRKLALKRLSASDLTLFKAYFDQHPSSKQKAINLNADVLVDYFYPGLPAEVPVQLIINGPGHTTRPDALTRKIVRSLNSKNRRLNGELVHNPTGPQPDRYTQLQPGDIAVLEFFDGPAGHPERINMTLVSAGLAADAAAHVALNSYLNTSTRTMLVILEPKLVSLLEGKTEPGHPLQTLLTNEAELELLAETGEPELDEPEPEPAAPAAPVTGTPAAPRRVRTYRPKDFNKTARASGVRATPAAMARAKAAATENGEAGEALVNQYLTDTLAAGEFEWSSRSNAVGAYDFLLKPATEQTMVDVKTTTGDFNRSFHISTNEIKQAASAPDQYLIYRVYDVKGNPKLRISGNIREFAASLMPLIAAFPEGTMPDGLILKPALLVDELKFGEEIDLSADEEEDWGF